MTNPIDMVTKENEQNPIAVGAVSAAAGIALGTAAAMYLSNKENREHLMNSLEDIRQRSQTALKTFMNNSTDTVQTAKKISQKNLSL